MTQICLIKKGLHPVANGQLKVLVRPQLPWRLELDSTMGVRSRIDLPREGSVETAYRRLKKVIDEPSSPDNKKGSSKPDFKAVSRGMRSGAKKIAKTRIHDSRV